MTTSEGSDNKTYILDTNVIFHDPYSFKKFGTNTIVIPLVVLEEVDRNKKGNREINQCARTFNKQIDLLRQNSDTYLHDGVDMDNGGKLFVHVDPPSKETVETVSAYLDPNKNDNRILMIAMDLSKHDPNVVVVTKDCNLRVLCDVMGVKSEDYKESLISSRDIYETHPVIDVSNEAMSWIWSQDIPSINIEQEIDNIIERAGMNGFCEIVSEGDQKVPLFISKNDPSDDEPTIHVLERRRYCNVFGLKPKNTEQMFALALLMDKSIRSVCLLGPSGVGKTLLALAAALQLTLEDGAYEKIIISRPAVGMGNNELGYAPGTLREKMAPWLYPIYDSFKNLMSRNKNSNETFDLLEEQGKIEIQTLQHIRGRSIDKAIVIIDESQNLTPLEVKTIMTRAGDGCKVILTGDPYQIDASYLDSWSCGPAHVISRLRGEDVFGYVVMTKTERSKLAEIAAKKL